MNEEAPLAVAMDWGGTWNRVAVVDRDGVIRWETRAANSLARNREELLAAGEGILREAIAQCGSRPVPGVGLALAGPVDPETGILDQPPNLPLLDGVSPKEIWAPRLGLPVWVGNDADLAALGEYYYGAGKSGGDGELPKTLVYLTLSTGIGGGVVYRGQPFLGSAGMAAEVGHMAIESGPGAAPCKCGRRGCLEALASGTSLARIAGQRLTGAEGAASVLAGEAPENVTSQQVFRAARQGDPLALGVIDGFVEALGVGLVNILHLYNPDAIVLGGDVSGGIEELGLLPRIRALMLEQAMSDRHKRFRIELSQLEGMGGILGAAILVWLNAAGV